MAGSIFYMTVFTFLTLAQAKAPASAPSPDLFGMLVPFLCLGVIFYFLIIRPQKKKQTDHAKLVAAVKTGDEVITAGGLHGRIANVKETSVILKIAENTKIEVEKGSIDRVKKADTATA